MFTFHFQLPFSTAFLLANNTIDTCTYTLLFGHTFSTLFRAIWPFSSILFRAYGPPSTSTLLETHFILPTRPAAFNICNWICKTAHLSHNVCYRQGHSDTVSSFVRQKFLLHHCTPGPFSYSVVQFGSYKGFLSSPIMQNAKPT